jgi:hypothetical protein
MQKALFGAPFVLLFLLDAIFFAYSEFFNLPRRHIVRGAINFDRLQR